MIIDSKKYNGMCTCGHEHTMTTQFCIIEPGCISNLHIYIEENGLKGVSVAVYDEHTYHAAGLIRPAVHHEIVLPAEHLHADNHGVALLMEGLPEKCDYLLAIGAGTIHDIVRYCAYQRGIPFVSCPTAASVDGFCSSVAAMTWYGFKKTLPAAAPKIVVADLNIISRAPLYLAKSGFGDMIGKFIALGEWKISHLLTGEYFCSQIHDMTFEATTAVVDNAKGILQGDLSAYEKLIYGLLMSGLAMQLLGNSRCASGAEHHISHLIEMQPEGLGVKSNALHGEKVGVGTLLACREYYRLRKVHNIWWQDYPEIPHDYIKAMFGDTLANSIIRENENDTASGITASLIQENWGQICSIIDTIPEPEELEKIYTLLDMKTNLPDIDVAEEKAGLLLEYSPLVRNRLTLMRLRRGIIHID